MEEWFDVPGYDGRLQVSNLGRARSVRVLNPRPAAHTRYPVIYVPGVGPKHGRSRHLHALVAEVFLGPRPEGKQVNHKDGDRGNPRPENLEYLTPEANTQDALERGGKLLPLEIRAKVWDLYSIEGLPIRRIAQMLELPQNRVRSFITKKRVAEEGSGHKTDNPFRKKLDAEKRGLMFRMVDLGTPRKLVAETFKIDEAYLSRLISKRDRMKEGWVENG